MELTGGVFITLVVVLAVVALALCVRLLGKVPGRTRRDIAARAGLIVATQATTLLAVLVLVNSWGEFYASWGDLLGTDHSKGKVTKETRAGGHIIAPLGRHQGHLRPAGGAGRIDQVTVGGPRTGLSTEAYIVLPPQYLSEPGRRFPSVLALSSDPRSMATRLYPRAAPVIFVIMAVPNGRCVDAPGGLQAETFLAQDVPESVTSGYRTAAEWGVLGDQANGYCAAKLTLRRSDRFPVGVSLAVAYDPPDGNYYGGSQAMREENTLTWRLRHRQPPPATLLLATCDQSRLLAGMARRPLHIELAPEGAALPGILPELQRWLERRLGAPGAAPVPADPAPRGKAPAPGEGSRP